MQAMSEFVEQGLHFVEPHQGRLAFGRLDQVQIVGDDRADIVAVDVGRVTERAHPGAAPFGIAGIHVRHEQAEMLAGLCILDVIGRDVRIPALDLNRLQRDAEQFRGDVRRTRAHGAEFEIRLQRIVIEGIQLLPDLFGIVPPVITSDLELIADHVLHGGAFFLRPLKPWLPDPQEEFLCAFGCFRHPRFQLVMRMRFVAHQLGPLGAQLGNLDGEGAIVILAFGGAQAIAVKQFCAQVAVLALRHEGLVDGPVDSQDPFVLPFDFQGALEVIRQAGQLRFVRDLDLEGLGRQQQIAAEFRGQAGEFFIDRGDFGLGLRRQGRAIAQEFTMRQLQQTGVLLVQAEAVALVIDRLNAFEEVFIEADRRGLAGQHGPDFSFQVAQRVIRVGIGDVAEHVQDLVQRGSRRIERDDRILEGRCIRIAHNRINVSAKLENGFLGRWHIVLVANVCEGRHAIGRVPLLPEWIAFEFSVRHDDLRQALRFDRRFGLSRHRGGIGLGVTSRQRKRDRRSAA